MHCAYVVSKRFHLAATAACLGLAAATTMAATTRASTTQDSSVSSPQAVTSGQGDVRAKTLPNGMRLVVASRRSLAAQDAPRVSMRMMVTGGWLAERGGERGVVHLIEHIAATGNGEFGEAEIAKLRDEVTVPSEWGAWTSPAASAYFLTSRTNDPESLSRLVRYFRGIASSLRFETAAVDLQRRVVAAEMAARRRDDLRSYKRANVFAPGSDVDRARGYASEDVGSADLATIERLYRRVYQPRNITLVVVGDVDAAQIEQMVERSCGEWPWRPSEEAPIAQGQSGQTQAAQIDTSFDATPEGPPAVILSSLLPNEMAKGAGRRPSDNPALRVLFAAIGLRSEIDAAAPTAVPVRFSLHDRYGSRPVMQWEANPEDLTWSEALGYLLQRVHELDAKGFGEAEVSAAKRRISREMNDERNRAKYATNRHTAEALAMTDSIRSAADALENRSGALEAVGVQEVNRTWREIRQAAPLQVRVESADLSRNDAAAQIEKVRRDWRKLHPQLAERANRLRADTLLYRRPGIGRLASDERTPRGVRRISFSNGMLLDLVRRTHEGGWLEIAINVDAPAARDRLSFCDAAALPGFLETGGSTRQSAPEMREAIIDSEMKLSPIRTSSTGLAISASVRREDLTKALPFLFAMVDSPGFRENGTRAAQRRLRELMAQRRSDPVRALLTSASEHYAAKRTGIDHALDASCVGRSTMQRARRLIGGILASGRVELAIVGNFAEEDAVALVGSTFGAVPGPVRSGARPDAIRPAPPPTGTTSALVLDQSQIALGAMWDMGEADTPHQRAIQQIFATTFARLLYGRLVERNGVSYAPIAERVELPEWHDAPVLYASTLASPDRKTDVLQAFGEVAGMITQGQVAPNLFQTAQRLSAEGLEASYNYDRTWAFMSAQRSRYPDPLKIWSEVGAEFPKVTPEELQAYAESVNRRPKRTPYRRAKGTPFVEQRDGYDGRTVRAGCGVGRA